MASPPTAQVDFDEGAAWASAGCGSCGQQTGTHKCHQQDHQQWRRGAQQQLLQARTVRGEERKLQTHKDHQAREEDDQKQTRGTTQKHQPGVAPAAGGTLGCSRRWKFSNDGEGQWQVGRGLKQKAGGSGGRRGGPRRKNRAPFLAGVPSMVGYVEAKRGSVEAKVAELVSVKAGQRHGGVTANLPGNGSVLRWAKPCRLEEVGGTAGRGMTPPAAHREGDDRARGGPRARSRGSAPTAESGAGNDASVPPR